MPEYVFAEADAQEQARLRSIARAMDEATFPLLDRLGVGTGWYCAEIGGGVGTVASRLSELVGPSGRVVATDVEPRWLRALDHANLEVREHDITTAPPERAAFDLVHTRTVLAHIADWERALRHLVDTVRPGGLLVVEDCDLSTLGIADPPCEALQRFWDGVRALMTARGSDPFVGRRLVRALTGLGLGPIESSVSVPVQPPDELLLQIDAVGDALVATGHLSPADLDAARASAARTDTFCYGPIIVSVWVRV
jgi:SAM-dependent methyltransferase